MSLEIESLDVIRLIEQFCKENRLTRTLQVLQEESQVKNITEEGVCKLILGCAELVVS